MVKKQIEDASRKIIEDTEYNEELQQGGQKTLGNIMDKTNEFGDVVTKDSVKLNDEHILGFMQINLDELPSQGLFYPIGTKLFIRAAKGAEIKHWSTIDTTDEYNIDAHLNAIIERCIKITIPGSRGSYKDLKEIDRFWLIFAIREYTFKDGENKLIADIHGEKVEITKDVISYFDPAEKLMNFYDQIKRCFSFTLKNGEEVNLNLPSVGISDFMKKYKIISTRDQVKIDEDFARYSLFLYGDWKGLNETTYKNDEQDSVGWSFQKISLLSKFVDLVKESVNPNMTVNIGAEEVTVPLNFRGGLKALFIIPDILDELI